MLGATANGVAHLLRVGGGEHEHHMRRRFFEGLQQRCLGTLGEHVHFIEDVHLVPAGCAERCLLDEVAHGIDTVVTGGVEFMNVEAGATLHREARIAGAAGFAVDGCFTVEHLGQNARRGGLARAAGAREQVCLALAVVDDGIAQRPHHMLLPTHFTEATRPIAAIQSLCGHCCGAYPTGAEQASCLHVSHYPAGQEKG